MRLTAASAVALALLVPALPAAAQEKRPRTEQRVYDDYRGDAVIDSCKHTLATLKAVEDAIPAEVEAETPDFRPAIEAAIEQHRDGDCKRRKRDEATAEDGHGTPTDDDSSDDDTTTDDGAAAKPLVPPDGGDSGTRDSGAPAPLAPDDGGDDPPPATKEDVTPLAPVPSATVAPAPVPPAEGAGTATAPEPAYSNGDDSLPPVLLGLLGLAALLGLVGLLAALAGRTSWGERALARPRRAWQEAQFRAGGAWGDFTDWLRLGR